MRTPLWRQFWQDLSLSSVSAGVVAVLVGFSSSAVLIFQAAEAAGTTPTQASSWLWALGLGMGITSVGLSLQHRLPLVTAWSTPGAAVLIVSLSGFSLAEAIGAFILTGALITLAGFTGQAEKLTQKLSPALASAMLAGVLFPFGLNAASSLTEAPVLAGTMAIVYFLARLWIPRYAVLLVALVGLMLALALNQVADNAWAWSWTKPVLQWPEFTWQAAFSLTLPLFIVTMASQNLPGIATLTAAGYHSPTSSVLKWTGLTTLGLAPFGAFALNLAAITAAICMTSDAHPDPKKRYTAAVSAGVTYAILGLLAASVIGLFRALPGAYIMTLAGLALLPTIANSLVIALQDGQEREASLVTFLVTVANVTLFGIGGAFWGLVFGYLVRDRRYLALLIQRLTWRQKKH
ncbi:benzoate/H(+) symporter BenE family transporter [Saccharospirillum alexandrii]|uniref:benzoate/H(+) symporter BenE family transporter n=1 Tax=Saccharospirillum alexandrii TaxID=2448477 RepID=UPI000FD9CFDB|nr:benzoate/H(+) symporter BenE family transporter [Saccharospirillum alexandrii]